MLWEGMYFLILDFIFYETMWTSCKSGRSQLRKHYDLDNYYCNTWHYHNCYVFVIWKGNAQQWKRLTCFIAAKFIIARTWKQPRCPSADEWIRKLWYIYTMEYYSAIKKNSFESVLMRWMKLEPIIQSEVSQKEKHLYSILMHIYGI